MNSDNDTDPSAEFDGEEDEEEEEEEKEVHPPVVLGVSRFGKKTSRIILINILLVQYPNQRSNDSIETLT